MNVVVYLHDEPSTDIFEKKILWFQKHYTLVSSKVVYEYYYHGKQLKNACHLTIDDGWLSTYQVVFPILKKYNIPVSIFVSPYMCSNEKNFWYMESKGMDEMCLKDILINRNLFAPEVKTFPIDLIFKEMRIDDVYDVLEEYHLKQSEPPKARNVVNIDELLEMDKSGLVEIGAHTQTHSILSNENDKRAREEIRSSVEELSGILHRKVISFAYPNGIPGLDFGNREVELVKECGVKLAYSVWPGVMNRDGNALRIPRTCSLSRLKLGYVGLKLPSMHDQVKPRRKIRDCKLF